MKHKERQLFAWLPHPLRLALPHAIAMLLIIFQPFSSPLQERNSLAYYRDSLGNYISYPANTLEVVLQNRWTYFIFTAMPIVLALLFMLLHKVCSWAFEEEKDEQRWRLMTEIMLLVATFPVWNFILLGTYFRWHVIGLPVILGNFIFFLGLSALHFCRFITVGKLRRLVAVAAVFPILGGSGLLVHVDAPRLLLQAVVGLGLGAAVAAVGYFAMRQKLEIVGIAVEPKTKKDTPEVEEDKPKAEDEEKLKADEEEKPEAEDDEKPEAVTA